MSQYTKSLSGQMNSGRKRRECKRRQLLLQFLLGLFLSIYSSTMLAAPLKLLPLLHNQLESNPSPYLALHGKDPVAWQTWEEAILQRARMENKLIFVSIGYFSCHWCHVMQQESFSDPGVAAILNKHYIAIKVDRELFPALDARLIDFVERTRGSAGWPLNVILTPQAYPLVGMTYEPKQRFTQLLKRIQEQWDENADTLTKSALAAAREVDADVLATSAPTSLSMTPDKLWQRASDLYVKQALNQADSLLGGFGQQAKFPMVSQLNALLDVYESKANAEIAEFLRLTLEQMASQNLRDMLGGGFFRYTVDPDWQTPHFEKMLYDNANLAVLYLRAGRILQRADFSLIAYQTLDFMVAHMQIDDGGMISSFSAVDQHKVEGGYYLWQSDQVRHLLSDKQFSVIQTLWQMDKPSTFEAGYLPRVAVGYDEVARRLNLPVQTVVDESVAASKILVKKRAQRVLPRDAKRLAAWNGLALTALSLALQDLKAHAASPSLPRYRKYLAAAKGIHRYLSNKLIVGGKLVRAVSKDGEAIGQAALEDYAFVAEALLQWADIENSDGDRRLARELIDRAWQIFFSSSGWQQSGNSLLPLRLGVAAIADGALPSPSATLMAITLQVNGRNLSNINAAFAMSEKLLLSEPFNYPGQIRALNRMTNSKP